MNKTSKLLDISDKCAEGKDLAALARWIVDARSTLAGVRLAREVHPDVDERLKGFEVASGEMDFDSSDGLARLILNIERLFNDVDKMAEAARGQAQ